METNIIPEHFLIKVNPTANPDAVVTTEKARFTVLTSRIIRMEWSPEGVFEDRASQAFWFRNQAVPEFSVKKTESRLVIETGDLRLFYVPDQPFSAESLWVEQAVTGVTWHHGDQDPENLGGTARTLDEVNGATPISQGLISRSGWSVVDDSDSLVFTDLGWLEQRSSPPGQVDLYFFGFGHDYLGTLKEFNLISGNVPMIPRFVLGNWWSRYWEYTQEEISNLMGDFQEHQVPLSVCIIDMDWHITKTGNTSSGWTGYTWNTELFPDHEALLRQLHEKGLKIALNLHPASGIHPHEEAYPQMARAVGIDPATQEPVEFDITNPRFVNAYFNILHHPQEEKGIDFWWMDWQQGFKTRLSGLDPLWWLNHLHFLDLGRDGKRRSFIFSRWGGLGNHRYPIGFSGDSVITWDSLAFQPFFTATSSNVNYGWWSHDIGGHMGGITDAELFARWVQLGAFLPILRLHSTKNAFLERRPWGYDAETFEVTRAAMQLRHALIPYLYSMAWCYHQESIPPLLPMYYEHPEEEDAYACPDQYQFGSQLLVAPFIEPKDAHTRLSRAVVWLPRGDWFHYFNGDCYQGDGWHAVYGTLRDIPVFARAGAIVPEGPMVGWGGVDTPDRLTINIFPGSDGHFDLYEDEGNTNFYLDGAYVITPMRQEWSENETMLTIGPAQGSLGLVPERRTLDLCFRGFTEPGEIMVLVNGTRVDVDVKFLPETHTLQISGIEIAPSDSLSVTLTAQSGESLADRDDAREKQALEMVQNFRMENNAKEDLAKALPGLMESPAGLARYLPALTGGQMKALLEIATGAGLHSTRASGEPIIVLWNRNKNEQVTFQTALSRERHWWHYKERRPWSGGILPRFIGIRPNEDFGEGNPWTVLVNYFGFYTEKEEGR